MRSLDSSSRATLWLLAARIVPATVGLGEGGRRDFEEIVASALMDRSPATRRQFAAFLRVIRFAPLVRWGRTFDRLDGGRQDRVLGWLQDCPVTLIRKGFWGLKVMVFMGYYGRPESWAEIGYEPRFDSRERLDARA
jgi:hypothetical protein